MKVLCYPYSKNRYFLYVLNNRLICNWLNCWRNRSFLIKSKKSDKRQSNPYPLKQKFTMYNVPLTIITAYAIFAIYVPFICFAIWSPIEISTCFDPWKQTCVSCDTYPWRKCSCCEMGCVVMSVSANDYCGILSGNVSAIVIVIAIVILIWTLIANETT